MCSSVFPTTTHQKENMCTHRDENFCDIPFDNSCFAFEEAFYAILNFKVNFVFFSWGLREGDLGNIYFLLEAHSFITINLSATKSRKEIPIS